jgi:protein-ribulosamine 3-kinase
MSLSDKLKSELERRLGAAIIKAESISGGCISNAYKIKTEDKKTFFLKINNSTPPDMFETEAHGLDELRKPGVIRVPAAEIFSDNYIVTEYIETGRKSRRFFEDFGRNFAELHYHQGGIFGFYEDNYIGSNRQLNKPESEEDEDWTEFYFKKRLLFQLRLCERNGYATQELINYFNEIENKISYILAGSEEDPSLLHGDLWSGNYMVDEKGNACLIDPAVYYGHREADLAMTKLFGGYPEAFYKSYEENYPLKEGWEYRENIYKLYHVLNHLNLFGTSYYPQAVSLIRFYL